MAAQGLDTRAGQLDCARVAPPAMRSFSPNHFGHYRADSHARIDAAYFYKRRTFRDLRVRVRVLCKNG